MNDPYFDTHVAADRLFQEWRKHGKIIIALDYDDTIFDYHSRGFAYPAVISLVHRCAEVGAYVCIFTGSPPDKYPAIKAYVESLGIPVASINTNPFPMPFGNHGKMYYNILLDDRAGLGQAYTILREALASYLFSPTQAAPSS